MTSHANGTTGADVRAKLDHPVVDADGHMMETSFAVLDFVKQVGGPKLAERYAERDTHIVLRLHYPGMSYDDVAGVVERVGRDVIPRLAR